MSHVKRALYVDSYNHTERRTPVPESKIVWRLHPHKVNGVAEFHFVMALDNISHGQGV